MYLVNVTESFAKPADTSTNEDASTVTQERYKLNETDMTYTFRFVPKQKLDILLTQGE
jgi:hypothetical protein